jgi:hypothetical protein
MPNRAFVLCLIASTVASTTGLAAQDRRKPAEFTRPMLRVLRAQRGFAPPMRRDGQVQVVRVVDDPLLITGAIAVGSTPPPMPGVFRLYDAASKILDARNEVDEADDPAAALAAMDRVLEALDDARAALWELKGAEAGLPVVHEWTRERGFVRLTRMAVTVEGREPAKPPAFLEGACRAALDEFDGARKALEAARGLDPAFEALDRAMRALMKARRVLWRATRQSPRQRR